MKIVIDIPKEIYYALIVDYVFDASVRSGKNLFQQLQKCIANGTPLPESYGRLIDADDLYENTEICHSDKDGYACVRWKDINDAPTIIEGGENE